MNDVFMSYFKPIKFFFFLVSLGITGICFGQYGIVIVEPLTLYEIDDGYLEHDHFVQEGNDMMDSALNLSLGDSTLVITNTSNTGFHGHQIKFTIDRKLEIVDVQYSSWTDDFISGAHHEQSVQNVILSLNDNPFKNEYVQGRYVIHARDDLIIDDKELLDLGYSNESSHHTLKGKFKFYPDSLLKFTKRQILIRHHQEIGLSDSTGLYAISPFAAKFKMGSDSLQEILKSLTEGFDFTPSDFIVVAEIVVDNDGIVDREKIRFGDQFNTKEFRQIFLDTESIFHNWIPGIHDGMPVKSKAWLTLTKSFD